MIDVFDYYGFPICYRLERRKVGESLILSFRPGASSGANQVGPIVYEDGPIVITKDISSGMSTEEIVKKYIPAFLCRTFPLETHNLPLERKREAYELPFAVLVELNYDKLCKDSGWQKSTKAEYRKWCDWLIQRWGSLKREDITPMLCAPVLERESVKKHQTIARMLRQLFYVEAELGLIKDNPWEDYEVTSREPAPNRESLLRRNILESTLTEKQTEKIVSRCFDGLRVKTYAGYYFAVLLLLIESIPLEQACALTFGDFEILEHYPDCLVVNIRKQVKKVKQQYVLATLTASTDVRRVPLAPIIRVAYDAYKGVAGIEENQSVVPLPNNFARRSNPEKIKAWIAATFGDVFTAANAYALDKVKPPLPHAVLENTARRNLVACGLEEEEYRYHAGLAPQKTFAKHYCDFSSEAELNRMCKIQGRISNRWIPCTSGQEKERIEILSSKGAQLEWRAAGDGRCEVDIEIDIKPVAPEQAGKGLVLQLMAPRGARFTASYR